MIAFNLLSWLPICALWLLISLISVSNCDPADSPKVKLIADEKKTLSNNEIGSIMKEYSEQVEVSMKDEMDKLLNDVRSTSSEQLNEKELERFKLAHETLTEDTKTRIEMAGQKNNGELTQSWMSDVKQSFVEKASLQLQSASSFIDYQMSSLSGLAPKLRKKIMSIPGKLIKLLQWPTFLSYKVKYHKVYKSQREQLYRQLIYLNNQALCGIQNLKFLFGRASHLLKATQFADLTEVEYQKIYNNEEAEDERKDVNLKAQAFEPDTKLKLEKLAKENKNIFGNSMNDVLEKSAQMASARERSGVATDEDNTIDSEKLPKKRKRRAVPMEVSYNELDEEEDSDTEMEEAEYDSESRNGAGAGFLDDDDFDPDEFNVVDNYAAEFYDDANTDKLDEIENIMDQALKPNVNIDDDFKPIDLRQTGCIIQPEQQGGCGCCYAHATNAAASYYNCMMSKEKKPQRYNARFTSDCGRYLTPEGTARPLLDGCSGGKLSQAIKFTKIAGTQVFMNYELARLSHEFNSDKCAYPRPETIQDWGKVPVPFFKNTEWTNIKLSEVDLHLRTVGPVFFNMRTWRNFLFQGRGIYDKKEESECPIVHSTLIVGHDRDVNGRDYWIVWNSHGTAWGEYGFVRIYTESLEYFKVYLGGLVAVEPMDMI